MPRRALWVVFQPQCNEAWTPPHTLRWEGRCTCVGRRVTRHIFLFHALQCMRPLKATPFRPLDIILPCVFAGAYLGRTPATKFSLLFLSYSPSLTTLEGKSTALFTMTKPNTLLSTISTIPDPTSGDDVFVNEVFVTHFRIQVHHSDTSLQSFRPRRGRPVCLRWSSRQSGYQCSIRDPGS